MGPANVPGLFLWFFCGSTFAGEFMFCESALAVFVGIILI